MAKTTDTPAGATAADPFAELLRANEEYSTVFAHSGYDGIARAGVAVVTCMDSRIDPLAMIGLRHGDAKIFRNPGARVTEAAMEALVLGVHLLQVTRILIVPHTRCAMTRFTQEEVQDKIGASAGVDASWQHFGVITDQELTLRADVRKVRSHPLIPDSVAVAGFVLDVDSGRLTPVD